MHTTIKSLYIICIQLQLLLFNNYAVTIQPIKYIAIYLIKFYVAANGAFRIRRESGRPQSTKLYLSLHPHTKAVASQGQEEVKLSHCYSEDNRNNKGASQAILQSLDGVLQPVLQSITEWHWQC